MVDVKRCGDRIILVKLVLRDLVLNIISVYAPQVGLNGSDKRQFWEELDAMVRAVPTSEKLFIGEDLNGMLVMSWPMEVLVMVIGIRKERMFWTLL